MALRADSGDPNMTKLSSAGAGLPLSAADIFRHQTVTGLAAAVLESVKHTGNGTAASAGDHASAVPGDGALAPLSPIRHWLAGSCDEGRRDRGEGYYQPGARVQREVGLALTEAAP
jgi:hypothetical protein